MSVTVRWRGRPVVIRNRTGKEIGEARATPLEVLRDGYALNANLPDDVRATDFARSVGERKENWLILVSLCTHLGCVPQRQAGRYNAGYARAMSLKVTIRQGGCATALPAEIWPFRLMNSFPIRLCSLYYSSHKPPREVVWIIGVLIYLTMMATAFLGYVLVWSMMSSSAPAVMTRRPVKYHSG